MDKVIDQHIQQIFQSAAQAFESGRVQDAEQFLRQAEAEAPRHPLVLNEIARRMLLAGNPAGAKELLEQAVKDDPAYPTLWLNLAAALRGLQRADEELAALKKVLAIEPRNLRALLQAAIVTGDSGQSARGGGNLPSRVAGDSAGSGAITGTTPGPATCQGDRRGERPGTRSIPRGTADGSAETPCRFAAWPLRPVSGDTASQAAHLPAAADIHVFSESAGDRVP